MKKLIIGVVTILLAMIMTCSLIACGEDKKTTATSGAGIDLPEDTFPMSEEVETVVVTDAAGEPVTKIVKDANGETKSQVVTAVADKSDKESTKSNGNSGTKGQGSSETKNTKEQPTETTVPTLPYSDKPIELPTVYFNDIAKNK